MGVGQHDFFAHSGQGSVGPVIGVLAVITVLGVIAGMIGRLCSGRRIMGHAQYYDFEGWVERKCSTCLDGTIDPPPPPPPLVAPAEVPVAMPAEPPQEAKEEGEVEEEEEAAEQAQARQQQKKRRQQQQQHNLHASTRIMHLSMSFVNSVQNLSMSRNC
ncbi:double-strand-break repair protein rad21 homolog [Morus notabilis]|uniref:double-strand-break repair protein rad21 homolog n=1 Tax=Morus notabilis TaxID=981085 RepID=UPI000CED45F7|nr:double-strand-break repair protein rad21 homolog [Morus notabilis]